MIHVKSVHPPGAPPVKGPYSPAVRVGDFLFCSGQIGLDPSTGRLVPGGTAAELARALANLDALLAAEGLTPAAVVKTTLFLVDMGEFAAANEVYAAHFPGSPRPARSCVAVSALPAGARVEIEALAVSPRS